MHTPWIHPPFPAPYLLDVDLRLAAPDGRADGHVRLHDVAELVRHVVLATRQRVVRDRRAHVRRRHGERRQDEPLGARVARVETEQPRVVIGDAPQDGARLRRRELLLAVR